MKLMINWLVPGDIIIHGRQRITIEKIERCPHSRKGIPKYHVNDRLCIDSIAPIEVLATHRKSGL